MQRRNWLKGIGTGLAAAAVNPAELFAAGNKLIVSAQQRVLRIAHLTDIHLQHKKEAPDIFAKCLHHLQNLEIKPDIIFNGGDTIDDALMHTKTHVKSQWELFHAVLKNECDLRVEHCIGNHDVWGLITEKHDPLYGKQFALEQMQLEKTYRSFDINGWHFIVLDSTHEREAGIWYTAKLGNEQMEWLKDDLQNTSPDKPVMIISHIPVLSATGFFDQAKIHAHNIILPATLMHTDYKEITELFDKHKNIKLCISGHIHLSDHVRYNDISYFCNGAVCGDWWDAPFYQHTKAGYAVIDLYADGSFTNQYIDYNKLQ